METVRRVRAAAGGIQDHVRVQRAAVAQAQAARAPRQRFNALHVGAGADVCGKGCGAVVGRMGIVCAQKAQQGIAEGVVVVAGDHVRRIGQAHVLRMRQQRLEMRDRALGNDVAAAAADQQHRHVDAARGFADAILQRVAAEHEFLDQARIPVPAQTPVVVPAHQVLELRGALALAPVRKIGGDGVGRMFEIVEAVRMRRHETDDAFDPGSFPAWRDVHQHQGGERRGERLRHQAGQAAHRRADQYGLRR